VYGSKPDGWWNDRDGAATRFTQRVAEWCRTHEDRVVVVFDAPIARAATELGGGNLTVVESERHGRNAADDQIVQLAEVGPVRVVTSDRGLIARLDQSTEIMGVLQFRRLVDY
jgi:uncharacterized protein YaiI (UPF0178 family)